jgi:hypothetical protein
MAVRDFDPTQLASDFGAILDQAGITFTMGGNTVTGVWALSREMFSAFEDQRREDIRYTVFLLTSQLSSGPTVSQTLVRSSVTYFVEQLRFDAEGTGCEMDVCKTI